MRHLTVIAVVLAIAVSGAIEGSSASSAGRAASASPAEGATPPEVVLVGMIVTMDDPPVAEAIRIADGRVLAVGSRDEVMAQAGPQARVIELGPNVAYPGFIDAHAHWIGDRGYMGIDTPEQAMEAAASRGWTSIAELWVDGDRLDELRALADAGLLTVRVDAYLALNAPAPSGEHFGDWYTAYEPGPVDERLRLQGVKITLDNGWGTLFWWEPDELRETIGRAHEAGWQVAVHTVSTEADEMVLDAYESALAGGPNTLHHRIEHAIQVTDEQLARMVALDLVTVIHPGAATDWLLEPDFMGNLGEDMDWLARSKDFVDAGLHVAAASDAPWTFPLIDPADPTGRILRDDVGRPVDLIASAVDAKGWANPHIPDWLLDQLLTAQQGLAAVTIDAAYALGDEQNRGHLAAGTDADITIMSGDIVASTPDEIRRLSVIATIVGGVTEYCAQPTYCP